MNKYVRVMDGLKSNAGGFEYKLNEINISQSWNPEAHSGKEPVGSGHRQESVAAGIFCGDDESPVVQPENSRFGGKAGSVRD